MSKLYLGTQEIRPSLFGYTVKKVIDSYTLDHNDNILDLTGITDIGNYALEYAYSYDTYITSVDMSSLITISGDYACQNTFSDCTALTSVNLSGLIELGGEYSCYNMFNNCTALENINLSNICKFKTLYSCSGMFKNCTSLETIDLNKVKIIYGRQVCGSMFQGCTSLETVDLGNLEAILGNYACYYMFAGCTSLTDIDLSKLFYVRGFYSDSTSSDGAWYYMFQNCTSLQSIDLHNLVRITYGWDFGETFNGCTSLTSINLSSLIKINQFSATFRNCTSLATISFPFLNYAAYRGFQGTFSGCTNLQHIYFPAITGKCMNIGGSTIFTGMLSNVTGCTLHLLPELDPTNPDKTFDITLLDGYPNFGGTNTILVFDQTFNTTSLDLSNIDSEVMDILLENYNIFYSAFSDCDVIASADLSSFENINGSSACYYMFANCSNLQSVNLNNLKSVLSNAACSYMFQNCTSLQSLSFPALNSTSFGNTYTNQFSYMLSGCTGVTLHFPSNLQSTISGLSGYPNFDGNSTVLLYDLPATY